MLLAGWEVCIVKNCDQGLENAAQGNRPRAAFFTPITTILFTKIDQLNRFHPLWQSG